jgi:hypothetical protein
MKWIALGLTTLSLWPFCLSVAHIGDANWWPIEVSYQFEAVGCLIVARILVHSKESSGSATGKGI